MSRKNKNKDFSHNPFRELKGLSVSEAEKTRKGESPVPPAEKPREEADLDFAAEMTRLGVRSSDVERAALLEEQEEDFEEEVEAEVDTEVPDSSDEALFLEALDGLDTRFEDGVPVNAQERAVPRRMKQLRRGRLEPEAELDLHGLSRADVPAKVGYFLDNAVYHGRKTVLIITGRGLGSGGEPVLRNEAERFLEGPGRRWVSEWGRAPRRYGGEGALVVFLRSVGK